MAHLSDGAPVTTIFGIAKLLAPDCDALAKAGSCCHFSGVVSPKAERIGAGMTV
jgi:hypothetical protein